MQLLCILLHYAINLDDQLSLASTGEQAQVEVEVEVLERSNERQTGSESVQLVCLDSNQLIASMEFEKTIDEQTWKESIKQLEFGGTFNSCPCGV